MVFISGFILQPLAYNGELHRNFWGVFSEDSSLNMLQKGWEELISTIGWHLFDFLNYKSQMLNQS